MPVKVSILVPVYNVQAYLPACVESLLAQTMPDFELLLINDGSTDQSGALCDAYAQRDARIRVFHKPNGGQGDARNAGLAHARGEYLLFADSDDTLAPTALADCLAEMAADARCDAVLFDALCTDEAGAVVGHVTHALPTGRTLTLADTPQLLLATPSPCFRLCRRAVWEGITFPTDVRDEDLGTLPKLWSTLRGVRYLQKPLYFYLQRAGSSMHAYKAPVLAAARQTLCGRLLEHFAAHPLPEGCLPYLHAFLLRHCFLFASREVLAADPRGTSLKALRRYAKRQFPHLPRAALRQALTRRERLIFRLLWWGWPGLVRFASSIRR